MVTAVPVLPQTRGPVRLNSTTVKMLLSCTLLFSALPACSENAPTVQNQPAPATKPVGTVDRDFSRWEKQIAAYEAMDRIQPPPNNAILFIGSSSIRRWSTLAKDFPHHQVINRGFGGSHIVDATHFADRIIFPYQPKMILLRAGGNDISVGKSPEQVFEDYKAFVAKVRERLPKTKIVYCSIFPSPSNRTKWDAFKALNTLIEKYSRYQSDLKYIETFDMVLGPGGQPRPELFAPDRLHLSAEGYRLLAERVRPFLP